MTSWMALVRKFKHDNKKDIYLDKFVYMLLLRYRQHKYFKDIILNGNDDIMNRITDDIMNAKWL